MREQEIAELMSKLRELQKDWGAHIDKFHEKTKLIDRLSTQEESFW